MTLSRLHRRLAALAAVLAISLQALWPLIAQAQPRVAGELVPVCTVNGITHYIELPASKTPLEEGSASHGEHCQLCVFGATKANLVPPSRIVALVSAFSFEKPDSQGISYQEFPDYPPTQPRGPPVIS